MMHSILSCQERKKTALRELCEILFLGLLVALAIAAFGCGTPAGYDADLTPGDGADWVGGAPAQIRNAAGVRRAVEAHLAKECWCAWCGTRSGLEVHHIWPIHRRPDLAASDRNMITLCRDCHRFVAHPGGDSRKWISNIRELAQKRLLCGPGTDAP